MTAPLVEVSALTHHFSRHGADPVIEDISLALAPGELVALIGPSGCGKSTLLNALAGLVRPTAGRIHFASPAVRTGYVFQRPRLLPWRNVLRNVEYGLEQGGRPRAEVRAAAQAAIDLVNLGGSERKYPHELSGGMQQRVSLARGLAIAPDLFLLDEPFGALDALTRSYLQEELLGIVRRAGTTTLLVTHDIDEALLLADRVLVMSSRPGRIKAEVPLTFGADRSLATLIADPAYAATRTRLRELLRPEAVTAETGA